MSIITPREYPDLDPGEPLGPGERPRKGRSNWCDPDNRAFIAEWLGHVAAGRIGGNTPVNEEARAIVLANERLMLGHRRPPSA